MADAIFSELCQRFWGIPLTEHPAEVQVHHLIHAVEQVSLPWRSSPLVAWDCGAAQAMVVQNTMALLGGTLGAVLQYLRTRYDSMYYTAESLRLATWLHEVAATGWSQRLDVGIGFGGEPHRMTLPTLVRALLAPYALKRLYVPTTSRTSREAQTSVADVYALLCVFLVQAGMSSLDDDKVVWEFLRTYLHRFRQAKRLGVTSILGEILAPRRVRQAPHRRAFEPDELSGLPRFTWPEDYRGFRQYIGKTIRGLATTQQRHDSLPTGSTVFSVATRLGLSRGALYYRMRQGRVQTNAEPGQARMIPAAEEQRLRRAQHLKEEQHTFCRLYARVKGVSERSARRWVQRQLRQGMSWEDIRHKSAGIFSRSTAKEEAHPKDPVCRTAPLPGSTVEGGVGDALRRRQRQPDGRT